MNKEINKTVKAKIRVGKFSYINCLPYYHNLLSGEDNLVEYYEGYPAKINQAFRQKKVDMAPISSLEYLNHQKDYLLLPKFIIGSRDFARSVLLFSREKIEGLNHARIALTKQSLSSVSLLKILLKFKYRFENSYVSFDTDADEALKKNEAVLLIGDDALFFKPENFAYKYDLSELWWNWTGKPFCFAVWAVRKEFAEAHPMEVTAFYRRLERNFDHNMLDIEALIRHSMEIDFMDAKFSKIFGYLFNLSYGMDEEMKSGLELFYRLAARLGISPRPAKLEFFKI